MLFEANESEDEYRIDRDHQIVECCGCGARSFRKIISYIEEAYRTGEDEWELPQDVTTFPAILKGHKSLSAIHRAPKIVREIYTQSVNAIKTGSNILAGIGLRATIEAICNERSVSGKNLEIRIDKLAKGGFVSQNDADRLHAIRFLGNDAAHEIQPADFGSLIAALKIVEHLIVSLYILDGDASETLDTLIKIYSEFEKLLDEKINTATKGDELPLFKILGKDSRRFHGYLRTHETQLISKIASGSYAKLGIGKLDSFAGSREKFQHFVVL
ncbi:MAG: DUF4145 domain-containing protein [Pseudomonadota bacterium]|nr:DUF4145 domain-containing protein [Pseudomonadota bacterium]